VWFDPGAFDSSAWSLAQARRLTHCFAVPGTSIVLASRLDLLQWPELRQVLIKTDVMAHRTQAVMATGGPQGPWQVREQAPAGVALQGLMVTRLEGLYEVPSVTLPAGAYRVSAKLRLSHVVNDAQPLFELWKLHPWMPSADEHISVHRNQLEPLGGDRYALTWPISIPDTPASDTWSRMVKLAWRQTGNASYTIEQWHLSDAP
jgi:hypothetical protein